MPKFRVANDKTYPTIVTKKPVVIEAVQFHYPASQEFRDFCGISLSDLRTARHPGAIAEAEIDGVDNKIMAGDWIIKDAQGKFSLCKPDLFEQTYEKVEQ